MILHNDREFRWPSPKRPPRSPNPRRASRSRARSRASPASLTLDDVPEAVVERAKLHILDAVGIGLAASRYDFSHKTLTAIQGLAGDGPYPVIGMPARLPLRDAAQMNGFLIHGLDYDDTHVGGVIHATTSAVPTVMAAGQRHGASGRAMLEAYLVAIEGAARIAAAAQGGFHRLGFHPTGMVGVFGAALAAGRLAGMTEAQLAHAQGIALSMASGSLQFLDDGAWTKRMHPGWAAVAGISAAALAQQGFQGPAEPYEGRFGLYALYGAPRRGDRLGDVHRRPRRGLGDAAHRHQALPGLPPGPRAGRCGRRRCATSTVLRPPMSRALTR